MSLKNYIGKTFTRKDGENVILEVEEEQEQTPQENFEKDSMVYEAMGFFRAGKTIEETLKEYRIMDIPKNIKGYTIDTRFKYLGNIWNIVGFKEEKPLHVKFAIKNFGCTMGLFVDAGEAEKFQKVE